MLSKTLAVSLALLPTPALAHIEGPALHVHALHYAVAAILILACTTFLGKPIYRRIAALARKLKRG